MKTILTAILLSCFCVALNAQHVQDSYVIVTIEKKTSSKLHPLEFDYWIISESMWRAEDPFLPLYIDGFSKTDMDECCLSGTLVLFNTSSEESFNFEDSYKRSTENLRSLVLDNKRKVLLVKKKWKGYKEQITVYLTPIKGTFCICELKHSSDNAKLGYIGNTAIPLEGFSNNVSFWQSDIFDGIGRFDYTTLPFLSLQKIQ